MFTLEFTPHWFYGKDIFIDAVSVLILLLISIFSFRYYRLDKGRKAYVVFSISFLMLAASFLFKILTNFTLYYPSSKSFQLGVATITVHSLQGSNLPFFIGYLAYRGLTLLGLFTLYLVYRKDIPNPAIFLIVALMGMVTYFTDEAFYMFHLTSLLLLTLICKHLWDHTRKSKQKKGNMLFFSSFVIIALSQLSFIFLDYDDVVYPFGELIQLLGYVLLLVTFAKVLRNAKEA